MTSMIDALRARLAGIGYGADYNPEQWDPAVWEEDIALMREAGVTIVTLGIFSWATVEPEPGRFDFTWMDRVMDLLHEAGIAVSLATGTASPPPWLARLHPESLPVTEDGVRLSVGSRQQYCPSSPVYRDRSRAFVEQLARRYGDHPALALWHINNEYGCHLQHCHCDVSAADFRQWLRARHGSLDALNSAWSTTFWSQRYAAWEEIVTPRLAPTLRNPAQELDFKRFSSDALRECFRVERDLLRKLTPDMPLTTNMMGLWESVDYFQWGPEQDVISHDCYPDPLDPNANVDAALAYDVMRGVGGQSPFLLMESAPSAVNWRERNPPRLPGAMRLNSLQAVAHGADAVMFFQWRASQGGAEKFHSAMVPHGGTSTRTWKETSAFGAELPKLSAVVGAPVRAEVALLHDWSNWWALELEARPSSALRLPERLRDHYAPLWRENAAVDVVHPESDLSRYRLVVVPSLYLCSDAAVARIRAYVDGGGHLLMSFFSGIVDPDDRVRLGGYPAPFRDLLGLRIDEFWPLGEDQRIDVRFNDDVDVDGDADAHAAELWADVIVPEGAQTVAAYRDAGPLGDVPAVTVHDFGAGRAWYVGARLDEAAMRTVVRRALDEAGVQPPLPGLPDAVEAVVRTTAEGPLLFLLNHGDGERTLALPAPMTDLLAGDEPAPQVTLAPRGVAVLRGDHA
ncbi:MAG TPA: beta-galactosidase [Conexibacter sp.]|jgi:beta-galactosidase